MDKISIKGGIPLKGQIRISGAKNAALPLMAASLLTDEPLVLGNIPDLGDIHSLLCLLNQHGTTDEFIRNEGDAILPHSERVLHLRTKLITTTTAPYELVRKMRASILVLGPLLARCGEAKVSLPGGCAIGTRPVDVHIKGLTAMGADITLEEGYIHATVPNRLKGADISLPVISVTGTENLMMAAVLAEGTTRLFNAALEPEVGNLAHCLNAMGAKISGIGTNTLVIEGVARLHGAYHRVLPDRIETGTYAIAAAITGGDIELLETDVHLLPSFISTLQNVGITIEPFANGMRVTAPSTRVKATNIRTEAFPGLPTDLQAQMMALLSLADGDAVITETIFENRFMHVPELMRMGADLTVNGSSVFVRGVDSLKGAEVMATDLRASVSLVLAGLAAEGETMLNRVYHLDRGYERIEAKLAACGAHIVRIKEGAEAAGLAELRRANWV